MEINLQDLLETAGKLAGKHFRGEPDVYERVADVQSTAWELSLKASDKATVNTLCKYALRRVLVRRQFAESVRCLETIPKEKRANRNQFRRVAFDPKCFASMRDNPAELASFRIDLPAWLASLTPQKRDAARLLAAGERTGHVAKRLGVSPTRVAQLRVQLVESWKAAHS